LITIPLSKVGSPSTTVTLIAFLHEDALEVERSLFGATDNITNGVVGFVDGFEGIRKDHIELVAI
jgi:hypothetical protein